MGYLIINYGFKPYKTMDKTEQTNTSMKTGLLEKVDKQAFKEGRTRSNMFKIMAEFYLNNLGK